MEKQQYDILLEMLWKKHIQNARNKNSVRINGILYVVKNETRTTRLSASSHEYEHWIEFRNGRKVYTTNLCKVGKIPDKYLKMLPDNAKFSTGEKKTHGHQS